MSQTPDNAKIQELADKYKSITLIPEDEKRRQEISGFFKEVRNTNPSIDFGMKVMQAISDEGAKSSDAVQKWSDVQIAFFAGGFRIAVKRGEEEATQYINDYIHKDSAPIKAIRDAINEQAASAKEDVAAYECFEKLVSERLLEVSKKQSARSDFVKGYPNTTPPSAPMPDEGKWIKCVVSTPSSRAAPVETPPATPQS